MNLDWLIIGGGIHGVHIAARLIGEADVEPERLRIVDPGERLLERWRRCTATTGMTHLRSPSVHNLDLNPWSMLKSAGRRKKRKAGLFAAPYDRPNLSFFNDHCDQVIRDFDLDGLHIRARATTCTVDCDAALVGLSTETQISTANVVFAIGAGEQPLWPDWAPKDEPRVQHIFDPDFHDWPSAAETIAVVGGGISAGQVALRLVEEGHDVHLISRHALREHQFDSDPAWLGPRNMAGFEREKDADKRRKMISEARHKGSVPPHVRRALRGAIARKELQWHENTVDFCRASDSGLTMGLADGNELNVERVLMATGFAGHRPGGKLIDELIESAALPCASCGYPIVDRALRWHPRVYVSGPLAELELGPTSRNISGARRAAERLVAVARAPEGASTISVAGY